MPSGVYKRTAKMRENIKKSHSHYWKGKTGKINPNWKGSEAKYTAKHMWIIAIKGKPSKCEHCGTENAKKFEWANIDHKYSRNPDDYIRLCHRCHAKYDKTLKVDSVRKEKC